MLSNPLRVLDSKNQDIADILKAAPQLLDYLDEESAEHFDRLKQLLNQMDIPFVVNTRLVRGLDYYCRTVFEWVTTELGTQGTICAGGRYDGLVEQLGGKANSGLGFAMGLERIVLLLEEQASIVPAKSPHLYVVMQGEAAETAGFKLTEQLRDELPALRIINNTSGGSFKSQMKRADKSGADFAMILGDNELAEGEASLKPLRNNEAQSKVGLDTLKDHLNTIIFTGKKNG